VFGDCSDGILAMISPKNLLGCLIYQLFLLFVWEIVLRMALTLLPHQLMAGARAWTRIRN
jgi:hypothetical protein